MRLRTAISLAAALALAVLVGLLAIAAPRPDRGDVAAPPPPRTCTADDPTTDGCLTPSALRLRDRVVAAFGPGGPGAAVRSITCWADRPQNPGSDHPAGRACDVSPTSGGTFAQGAERDTGWAIAQWARDNAADLDVRYVIWQGRIWTRGGGDTDGWGSPYDGGGVYDPQDATGGHFDHVHISVGP